MKILSINPFNYQQKNLNPSFERRGKPIDLKYIVQNHSDVLPPRVLSEARKVLQREPNTLPTLKDLHTRIFAPLLECKTIDDVRKLFPEFAGIKDSVTFIRDNIYARQFKERTKDINFPLKMLQELWGKLKNKDEVAQELGMKNRNSVEWALKQIGFTHYPSKYKTLIIASDELGNKEIARKTTEYNKAHPEQMFERNKKAAQSCKTEEYRSAHSKRMIERDKVHPERRKKISEADKRAWELCPEVREAMSIFSNGETAFIRGINSKASQGIPLSNVEKRARKGFFKRFWAAYPELKEVYTAAKKQAKKERMS